MDIGLAGAFVGGIITLLSPCSVMLLPAFFAYAFGGASRLVSRTGVFYLGLLTTLVPLGVLAGGLGAQINRHRFALVDLGAGLVIALGIVQVVGIGLPAIGRRVDGDVTTTASVYLFGTVYGLAGVCAGPVLGSVLAFAAMGGDPLRGGVVLAVFALGMVVPLLALSIAWPRLPWVRRLVRPRLVRIGRWENTVTQVVGGLAGIAVGIVLLVTDATTGIGGVLGTSDQYELETWALGLSDRIPDLVVVTLAAAALAGVWLLHRRRARGRPAGSAGDDGPDAASAPGSGATGTTSSGTEVTAEPGAGGRQVGCSTDPA